MVVKHEKEANYPFFKGRCNFHRNCVENMVTNFAVAERLKCSIDDLANISDDNEVWDMLAYYLAQLCLSLTYTLSPHAIILGGGLLNRKSVLPTTRKYLAELNNGYVDLGDLEGFIRAAAVAENGLHGCAAFDLSN